MTNSQRLAVRSSEIRQRLNEIAGLDTDAMTDEIRAESDGLVAELATVETQYRAALVAEDAEQRAREAEFDAGSAGDGEPAELRALLGRVGVSEYLGAAVEQRALAPEAGELNAALEIRTGGFPLRLLAPEVRATTAADAMATQGTWVDRLFADTAAAHLGITMRSVAPGVAAFPVTTAGAAADQLDKAAAAGDAAWTVGVTELKPTRNAARVVFTIEDTARLPGLEEALRRDLAMALVEGTDRAIFLGDTGPATATQDIVGLVGAAGVTEVTLTQANKVKGPETLAAFIGRIDGKHASDLDDLRVVTSVGAQTLWYGNFVAAAADTATIATFLRANRLMWMVRGEIDTATANGDFGAFMAGQRGIEGAAMCPVWEQGQLIRDPYSGAAKGEVAVTLSYLWNFGLPRASHFARLKFVT